MKCPMCGHENAGGSLCAACGESMVEKAEPQHSFGRRLLGFLLFYCFGLWNLFIVGPFLLFVMEMGIVGWVQMIGGVCCTIAGALLRLRPR